MARNPFLPKLPKKPTQWRVGAAKGTVGLPALQPLPKPDNLTTPAWRKDPSGRKPKAKTALPEKPAALDAALVPARPSFPNAGRLCHHWGVFLFESTAGWGSNLDMVALAHGPVGCGAFAQSFRPNMPGFIQGIESFTALHACTGLTHADLEESGDTKLERALDEINALFPLSRGVTVLNQDPAVLVGANIYGIAKTKTKQLGKLILTPSKTTTVDEDAVALKAAVKHHKALKPSPYDVAIPFMREATGLVWPVAKLLRDIGLNPVHEYTGSSTSELARIASCRLVLGFGVKLDFPQDHLPNSAPQRLRRWFGMQLVWTLTNPLIFLPPRLPRFGAAL